MGRSKIEDHNTRKLFKVGNGSYSVTIPVDIIREFKWQEGQKVTVVRDGSKKRIVIEDWKG